MSRSGKCRFSSFLFRMAWIEKGISELPWTAIFTKFTQNFDEWKNYPDKTKKIIHILGRSVRGELFLLLSFPHLHSWFPVTSPREQPWKVSARSAGTMLLLCIALPSASAALSLWLFSPTCFFSLFLTSHPHLWLTGAPCSLLLASKEGEPLRHWTL